MEAGSPTHIRSGLRIPQAVNRGKAIYDVNCALCHGDDARGGDNGPNLIRGEVVMNDQNGETIGKVLATGRLAEGMPKFEFTAAQVSDVAAFLHSFRVGGYDSRANVRTTIVVGDAKAGAAYFQSKCAACHSATGDLKGIGARITRCPHAAAALDDADGRTDAAEGRRLRRP